MMGQPTVFEEIHLKDYLWVVRKRLALVLVPVIVALAIGIYMVFHLVPEYSATTQVLVGRSTSPMMDTEQYSPIAAQDVNTYCEIIRGSALSQSVVERLGIQTQEELGFRRPTKSLWEKVRDWARNKIRATRESEVPKPPSPSQLAETLRKSLTVMSSKESRLINIMYTCEQPDAAAKIANATAETFIDDEIKRRMENVRKVLTYLRRSQREFEKNLKKSEQDILNFQDKKLDAIVLGLDEKAKVQDALSKTVETLTDALARTRVERIKKEAVWNELQKRIKSGTDLMSIPAIASHPIIKDLRAAKLQIRGEMIGLSTKYGPRHPKTIALQKSLESIDKQMAPAIDTIVKNIEYSYKTSIAEENTLTDVLKHAKQDVRKANLSILEYNQMVRVSEMNRDTFNVILKKASETSLVRDVESVNLHITNPAQPDLYKIKSKKGRTVFLSLFLGLIVGVGLAFFVDYMDNSIRDPRDVESYLQSKLLGMLELVSDVAGERGLPLPTLEHPKSTVAENFRTLRTNLLFSPAVIEAKQLVVTSTIPREGKTTVSSNLAVVLAQSGRKVLLVDADMRRPYIHKIFDLDRDKGLSTYLIGEHALDDIIEPTNIPGLHAVSAGPIPPNQSELLGSEAFLRLVEEAKQRYDILLFDTPPMSVTDPVIVARMGGGVVLLVVRSGKTPRNHVKRVLRDFMQFGVSIAGVLLNQVNVRSRSYYRYYYYDYYYYGYGTNEGKEGKTAG